MQSAKPLIFPLILCRTLAWSPLWMLILSLTAPAKLLPCTGILLAASVPAALAVRAYRIQLRAFPAMLLTVLTVLPAAVLCGYFVRTLCGSLFAACTLTAVTLFVVLRGIESEPDQLFPVTSYAAFLTGTVLAYALLASAQLPVSGTYVLSMTGLLSACYFLLRNQLMLCRLAGRRSTTSGDVPADIRRANLLLAGGTVLMLALIFCFRSPLLHLLMLMQEGAKQLVFAILRAVTRTIAWLGGDAPITEAVQEEDDTAVRLTGQSSPLWLLLWLPILAAAGYVWHVFLSDWFYTIRDAVTGFIRNLKKDKPEQGEAAPMPEEAAYFDTAVRIRPAHSLRQKRRIWRRKLRAWQRLPDTRETFYAGYRLLLESPVWTQPALRDADTVREIREKWAQHHTPAAALDAVTADFQSDRYAQTGLPSQANADLARALKTLEMCLRRI